MQFRLHNLHDLRETEESWMTPVPELFIPPEQALHGMPPLTLFEPEGEFCSQGIWGPSTRRGGPPNGKDDV
jgi:hypothetical protein